MSATLTTAERAHAEAATYVWFPHNYPGFEYCLSQSEHVYEVSKDTCTCPAFQYQGATCKHIRSFRARLKAKGKGNE
jgi:hypothetical protein